MDTQKAQRNALFAVEFATAAILFGVAVWQMSPDFRRQVAMRGYRLVSRTAKHQADTLSRVATAADTAYWRCVNVTA